MALVRDFRTMSIVSGLAALTMLAAVSPSFAAPSDPSQPTVSVSIAPVGHADAQRADCSVQLLRAAEDEPSSHACGVPISVAEGRYSAWIETADRISAELLGLDLRAGAGQQSFSSRLVPAVSVQIRADGVDPSLRVGLLHTTASFQRELSVTRAVGRPVLMPAGAVVAASFGRRGDVVTISRPVAATAGSTVIVDITKQIGSALIGLLEMSDEVFSPRAFTAVTLRDSAERPADLLLRRGGEFLAVWYLLGAGRAVVEIRSEELFVEAAETTIRDDSASTVRARIRRRPALTVTLAASESEMSALADKEAVLRLVTHREQRTLAEERIDRDRYRFEHLPPEVVVAVIDIGGWKVSHRIDLTAGMDIDETIEIDAIEVSGRITYGGDPAAARIRIRGGDESTDTEADETGRYETLLWQTGRFVAEVWLRDEPAVPSFHDTFRVDADTSTLDFRIPRTNYRVAVLDRETGKPIVRASVGFLNRWNDPDVGARSHGRAVLTDESGIATLPPLHAGDVEVRVGASGYRDAEVVRFVAAEGEPVRTPPVIEVRLEAAGRGEQVQFVLPDGSAAAGAALMIVGDGVPSHPLFRGTTDANGAVAIPAGIEGSILLVRHPAAGTLVRRWTGRQAQDERWMLVPAAGPLLVRVRASDETPVRFASIVLWVNGLPLSGPALIFLMDQAPQTDGEGIFTVRNLAPEPFRIVALRRGRQTAGEALAPLATLVPFPWPNAVVLRVLQ